MGWSDPGEGYEYDVSLKGEYADDGYEYKQSDRGKGEYEYGDGEHDVSLGGEYVDDGQRGSDIWKSDYEGWRLKDGRSITFNIMAIILLLLCYCYGG